MDKPDILKSRKFWILVFDVFVSVTTYFVAKYVNPAMAQDVLFLIGSLQPVVLALIASITVQNVEAMKVQGSIDETRAYNELRVEK
jgi:hypothetical protein